MCRGVQIGPTKLLAGYRIGCLILCSRCLLTIFYLISCDVARLWHFPFKELFHGIIAVRHHHERDRLNGKKSKFGFGNKLAFGLCIHHHLGCRKIERHTHKMATLYDGSSYFNGDRENLALVKEGRLKQ